MKKVIINALFFLSFLSTSAVFADDPCLQVDGWSNLKCDRYACVPDPTGQLVAIKGMRMCTGDNYRLPITQTLCQKTYVSCLTYCNKASSWTQKGNDSRWHCLAYTCGAETRFSNKISLTYHNPGYMDSRKDCAMASLSGAECAKCFNAN